MCVWLSLHVLYTVCVWVYSATFRESLLILQVFADDIIIQAKDWTVFSCQQDILKRAAILDTGQKDAVRVSCCISLMPENGTLFLLGKIFQHGAPESQVEN